MYRELDKFYTNRKIVKKLVNKIDFKKFDLVIEPSAGDGAFVENINHKNLIALDIHPEGNGIKKQDWFKYKVPPKFKKVLIIGNPPFGKNNNLSMKFLEHAFSFENVIEVAFVLPNVYKKHTMQKIIPTEYKINKIVDMGRNSFTLDKNEYHVPCSFFVISKDGKKDLRQDPNLRTSDFSFGNKNDFDFFIFGAAPRKIINNPKENNRGYFIKSNINIKDLKERFRAIKWQGHSSANGGVYWLTKVDIVENYLRKDNHEQRNIREN